jgi:hypothetical protein
MRAAWVRSPGSQLLPKSRRREPKTVAARQLTAQSRARWRSSRNRDTFSRCSDCFGPRFPALDIACVPHGGSTRTESPRPSPSQSKNPKAQDRETDFQKAEYLIKAEKYEEAIPLLRNVVADNARDADAWNYLGFASRKLGKNEDALGYYQKALAIDPAQGRPRILGELHLITPARPRRVERAEDPVSRRLRRA